MISKLNEEVIIGDYCYTKVQILMTDNHYEAATDLLNEIIKSNHHFWQGDKFPDGMDWTFTDEKGENRLYRNVKIFGFYDNDQIRPNDYKKIDYHQLESSLVSFILQETGDEDYKNKIDLLIRKLDDPSLECFEFLPENLLRSDLSVYTYFIAFILLDKELKNAVRIEFGQD